MYHFLKVKLQQSLTFLEVHEILSFQIQLQTDLAIELSLNNVHWLMANYSFQILRSGAHADSQRKLCFYPFIQGNAIGSTYRFPFQDVSFFLYFIFIILNKRCCHLVITQTCELYLLFAHKTQIHALYRVTSVSDKRPSN